MALLALLFCVPVRSQQQNSQQSGSGDPVADAARKARGQKKDAPKPKKGYTDDDIVTKKTDISVVGTAPVQQDQATTQSNSNANKTGQATATEREKKDPNTEKTWRKRSAN